jgi:hypothetical protein
MPDMNHAHQAKLFDPKFARPVTLLGAGSVGSWCALLLAKIGVTDIRVYDEDSVGSHNVPMSLYGIDDVGKHKVDALHERILRDTGIAITAHARMYEGESLANTSVIAAVDTMAARRLAWKQAKDRASVDLFCDTRLDAAFIDVLAVDPSNPAEQAEYEKLDFADEEALVQICGLHGIAYASVRAAGIVAANLTQYWMGYGKQWRVTERCDTLLRVH